MTLIISPLSRVHDVVAFRKPSHLVTLIGRETAPPVCAGITPERHLKLHINDIVTMTPGLVAPDAHTVQTLLDFAERWDRKAPMLIHCLAGISRSTAGAYILACSFAPPGRESALAEQLRAASRSATPNILMVALADNILERDGAMVAAIKRIGRGAEVMESEPFDFPI